ncbi:MAG: HD domain-containing protein [Candidatus Babeliales bacterium]
MKIFMLSFIFYSFFSLAQEHLVLETIYGKYTITEPVLIELLEHPMMQRLKKVRQYGVNHFMIKPEEYHRYEHSIGVFLLLRMHGASLHEQIAGLLHDVSHTVFSHVGDWVFQHADGLFSYQDTIHEDFLYKSGLHVVLEKHGFAPCDVVHKNKEFSMLEQDLPDLCADRIEYNLQGGLREQLITQEEFQALLENLHYQNGHWFFTDQKLARSFAEISLYHTKYIWGSCEDLIVYMLAGKILKDAVAIHYLTLDDIHFGTDDDIWQRLCSCTHPDIVAGMHELKQYKELYQPTQDSEHAIKLCSKFRGVDPYVKKEGRLYRLTELDVEYKQRYDAYKKEKTTGCYFVKLL